MSQPNERTAVLASVFSVAEAVEALRAGAQFVDPGPDEALLAVFGRAGFPLLDRTVVQVEASAVADAVARGLSFLVDVDDQDTPAAAGAIAAVCAWQGARIIRTRHVTEVRRCLDMTESILGLRRPALAVRGLA